MADTKHTPGPWGPRSLPDMVGTENMLIASVYPMHGEAPEECEANACLIAAAPDMLAALEATAAYLQDLMQSLIGAGLDMRGGRTADQLMTVRAAIAKATGARDA